MLQRKAGRPMTTTDYIPLSDATAGWNQLKLLICRTGGEFAAGSGRHATICGFGANAGCAARGNGHPTVTLRIRFVALCVGLDTGKSAGRRSWSRSGPGTVRAGCYIFEAQTVADQKQPAPRVAPGIMSCRASG